jgi:hypothetical protein
VTRPEWWSKRTLRRFPYYNKISHINRFMLQQACNIVFYNMLHYHLGAQAWRSRVRFLMRSLDFFNWPNSSSRTMISELTQPLTEMSTTNPPGGIKGGRCVKLTTSSPSASGLCRKCGSLDVLHLYEPLRPVKGIVILSYTTIYKKKNCSVVDFKGFWRWCITFSNTGFFSPTAAAWVQTRV